MTTIVAYIHKSKYIQSTTHISGTHIQDGAIAVVTTWREEVMIVLLAVGLAVAFEEVP